MEEPYIPIDPYEAQQRLKRAIRYTLQCLISIYIALEISEPPNPYKTHLIILLVMYICLKHNIVSKILSSIEKLIESIKSILA
jgi:hypothetical protein